MPLTRPLSHFVARQLGTAAALGLLAGAAFAQTVVGVSWSNFQEERWKTDEAAIKAQLEKLGAKYISADAGGSPEKQLTDIEGLMSKGAKALIVLAMDKDAILPAVNKATKQKVPVVAYDRLIEAPGHPSSRGRARSCWIRWGRCCSVPGRSTVPSAA